MEAHFLSPYARRILIACHHGEDSAKYADRLKTILWLDDGLSFAEISRLLFLDEKTPRRWAKVYMDSGIDALLSDNYLRYAGKLNAEQEKLLYDFVSSHLFLDVGPIILYVEDEFNVTYSRSGMRDLLHRIGFTYKKASCAPERADPSRQRRFLESFTNLMEMKSPDTPVLFMDATHPSFNSQPTYGWIVKGERAEVPTNNNHRQQLNINGALNAETHEVLMMECERLNAETAVALLQKIELHYPNAAQIIVITDNAAYYRAKPVTEYVANSRISLIYLPPYSPNLNLIERVWKLMHKHTVCNRLYATFREFREAILCFFHRLADDLADSLHSILTLNFRIASGKHAIKMNMV